MAFGLLPGLLFGAGLGVQEFQRRGARQEQQDLLRSALGSPGGEVQFPGMEMAQDLGPGTGLLGNPTDPTAQLEFAGQLMQIPGFQAQGQSMLQSLLQQQNQFQQQQQQAQAQAEQDALAQQLAERQRILSEEQQLRGEFGTAISPFNDQRKAFNQAMSALQGGGGFDAVAQVINFMKTLDPRSVVTDREGDQVVAAQGLFGGIAQQVNNALKGEGFTNEARLNIAETLMRQIMPAWQQATQQRQFFEGQATRQGLDPSNIIGSLGTDFSQPAIPQGLANPPPPPGAPQVVPQANLPDDLVPFNPRTQGRRNVDRRGRPR